MTHTQHTHKRNSTHLPEQARRQVIEGNTDAFNPRVKPRKYEFWEAFARTTSHASRITRIPNKNARAIHKYTVYARTRACEGVLELLSFGLSGQQRGRCVAQL